MTVQANYSISRETQDLVQDIRNDTDPVEKELPRLVFRVIGCISGYGIPLADALVDQMKIYNIQSRLDRFGNIVAKNATETSELGLQKQIYTNIKGYTENARNIKLGAGACALLSHMVSPQLRNLALLGAFAGVGFAVVHRYTAGTLLQATNRELAERTVKI